MKSTFVVIKQKEIAYNNITLPANSKFTADFNDVTATQYVYMFVYDGVNFIWTRSGLSA